MNDTKWNVKLDIAPTTIYPTTMHSTVFCCSHKTEIVFNVMCFELDKWATQMENINSKFEQPFVHENGIQLVRRIDSNIVIYVQNTSYKKHVKYWMCCLLSSNIVVVVVVSYWKSNKWTFSQVNHPIDGPMEILFLVELEKYGENDFCSLCELRQNEQMSRKFLVSNSLIRWKNHSTYIALGIIRVVAHICNQLLSRYHISTTQLLLTSRISTTKRFHFLSVSVWLLSRHKNFDC